LPVEGHGQIRVETGELSCNEKIVEVYYFFMHSTVRLFLIVHGYKQMREIRKTT